MLILPFCDLPSSLIPHPWAATKDSENFGIQKCCALHKRALTDNEKASRRLKFPRDATEEMR
jgi:hypothetical protein